jgi:hypothetical protein
MPEPDAQYGVLRSVKSHLVWCHAEAPTSAGVG